MRHEPPVKLVSATGALVGWGGSRHGRVARWSPAVPHPAASAAPLDAFGGSPPSHPVQRLVP
jgi:hypothetical protein